MSENLGRKNEDRVGEALKLLQSRWNEIVCFHHSKQSGELDTRQTDFLIFLRSKFAFPLQVKSSPRGAREHIRNHEHIIVIVVRKRDTIERLAQRVKGLIIRCYKKIMANPLPIE